VINRAGMIANIKLRDTSNGRVILSFFVGSEGRVTINNVPDGIFKASFLSAEKWIHQPYSQRSASSPYRACGTWMAKEFDEVSRYESNRYESTHWEYTIIPVVGGNAPTSTITQEMFYRD
jgi:hypothetical protein